MSLSPAAVADAPPVGVCAVRGKLVAGLWAPRRHPTWQLMVVEEAGSDGKACVDVRRGGVAVVVACGSVPPHLVNEVVVVRGEVVKVEAAPGWLLLATVVEGVAAPEVRGVLDGKALIGTSPRCVVATVVAVGAVLTLEGDAVLYCIEVEAPAAVVLLTGGRLAALHDVLQPGATYAFHNVVPSMLELGGDAPVLGLVGDHHRLPDGTVSSVVRVPGAAGHAPLPHTAIDYEGTVTALDSDYLELDSDYRTTVWLLIVNHLPAGCCVGTRVAARHVHTVVCGDRVVGLAACARTHFSIVTHARGAPVVADPPASNRSLLLACLNMGPLEALWTRHAVAVLRAAHPRLPLYDTTDAEGGTRPGVLPMLQAHVGATPTTRDVMEEAALHSKCLAEYTSPAFVWRTLLTVDAVLSAAARAAHSLKPMVAVMGYATARVCGGDLAPQACAVVAALATCPHTGNLFLADGCARVAACVVGTPHATTGDGSVWLVPAFAIVVEAYKCDARDAAGFNPLPGEAPPEVGFPADHVLAGASRPRGLSHAAPDVVHGFTDGATVFHAYVEIDAGRCVRLGEAVAAGPSPSRKRHREAMSPPPVPPDPVVALRVASKSIVVGNPPACSVAVLVHSQGRGGGYTRTVLGFGGGGGFPSWLPLAVPGRWLAVTACRPTTSHGIVWRASPRSVGREVEPPVGAPPVLRPQAVGVADVLAPCGAAVSAVEGTLASKALKVGWDGPQLVVELSDARHPGFLKVYLPLAWGTLPLGLSVGAAVTLSNLERCVSKDFRVYCKAGPTSCVEVMPAPAQAPPSLPVFHLAACPPWATDDNRIIRVVGRVVVANRIKARWVCGNAPCGAPLVAIPRYAADTQAFAVAGHFMACPKEGCLGSLFAAGAPTWRFDVEAVVNDGTGEALVFASGDVAASLVCFTPDQVRRWQSVAAQVGGLGIDAQHTGGAAAADVPGVFDAPCMGVGEANHRLRQDVRGSMGCLMDVVMRRFWRPRRGKEGTATIKVNGMAVLTRTPPRLQFRVEAARVAAAEVLAEEWLEGLEE